MDYKKRKLEEAQKLDKFFHALDADVERSLDLWCENGDEFSRKTHVRTAFALVEGMVQRFKAVALLKNELCCEGLISSEEITVLKEEQVELKQNGVVKIGKMKVPLLANFKFTMKTYRKVHKSDYEVDYSGQDWEAFQKAIKVRDRITHPKCLEDLIVSQDDIALVENGLSFFRKATLPLISSMI